MRRSLLRAALLLVALTWALPAAGQSEASHWGVAVGSTPHWQFPAGFAARIDRTIDMRGYDFSAGLVRGRDRGGDWGVTFVARRIRDGSTISVTPGARACVTSDAGVPLCAKGGYRSTRDAGAMGIEIHKFLPFGAVGRVQLGLNIAGGLTWFRGEARDDLEHLQVDAAGHGSVVTDTGTRPVAFATEMHRVLPLWERSFLPSGRVEAAAAIRMSPRTKLRLGGGISAPFGYHFVNIRLHVLLGPA